MTDLVNLYSVYGLAAGVRPSSLVMRTRGRDGNLTGSGAFARWWASLAQLFGRRR